MAKQKLDPKRLVICRISSSIENFRDKLLERFGFPEWDWWKNRHDNTVFFGMYHIGDYARFIWHRGPRQVFWCGGDILNLKKCPKWILWHLKYAKHYCENDVEKIELSKYRIYAEVRPACFEDFSKIDISYKWSEVPRVFVCCHPGYEEQYGVNLVEGIASTTDGIEYHVYGVKGETHDNVFYHGQVSNDKFNRDIQNYQAGLRLNDFDGFGEVLAKSILMGQWPISRIYYPYIDYAKDVTSLIALLKDLKNKKKPNTRGREYWLKELNKNPFI